MILYPYVISLIAGTNCW